MKTFVVTVSTKFNHDTVVVVAPDSRSATIRAVQNLNPQRNFKTEVRAAAHTLRVPAQVPA